MRDLLVMAAVALAGALIIAVPGALVLRTLQKRSLALNICVLLAVTVLAVVAGVVAIGQAMFISQHDLRVLLIVIGMSGVVALTIGWWLGRRLGRAAVWAEDARATERQLVAWVSHDLRTPLAGMRAMAEALEDGVVADPATVAEYHRRIRAETDKMASLVDDLFELSRINAGALALTMETVLLGDVVSDAVSSAEPVAAARRIRLVASAEGWPAVHASEPELARIVANLLRNAIHYTPSDGTITVTGGRDGDEGWVSVADTCGGIADADLPRVFDVAYRGSAARTPSQHGGGGLGLTIVRGLVEAHGGRVSVQNVAGGCRFTVRLPVS